jgi:hypothetical protein
LRGFKRCLFGSREVEKLTEGIAELRSERDTLQQSADARLAALEAQQAVLLARVNGDMAEVSAVLGDIKKLDLPSMRSEVHRRGWQLDETEIIVKHLQHKVRKKSRP